MEIDRPEKKRKCTSSYPEMDPDIDNTKIDNIKGLLYPQLLLEEIPTTENAKKTVLSARQSIKNIMEQKDDRLFVVVGPCSIHDVNAALEYANRLVAEANKFQNDLLICMRVYFEKPRTIVGWKGLINDPHLDQTFDINSGLRLARKLLTDINDLTIPCATEFLDTMIPQYFADLISWAAIGARTTESQLHRELVSGLSMPVGFKNGTSGDTKIAVEACKSSMHPHCFLSISKQGIPAIILSKGNRETHIVLRGGTSGPNYSESHVKKAVKEAEDLGVCTGVMVDLSHGNSNKNFKNQAIVANEIAQQIKNEKSIFGVMIESHLFEGAQSFKSKDTLRYGVSITDACVGWVETIDIFNCLAKAVQERRQQ